MPAAFGTQDAIAVARIGRRIRLDSDRAVFVLLHNMVRSPRESSDVRVVSVRTCYQPTPLVVKFDLEIRTWTSLPELIMTVGACALHLQCLDEIVDYLME
jgi:hypothetical protein